MRISSRRMKFDQKSSSYSKFHKRQFYRKGRYTLVPKSQERKKVVFGILLMKTFQKLWFLSPVTSILTCLQSSQQCDRGYRPFRSFFSSNFYNSFFVVFYLLRFSKISQLGTFKIGLVFPDLLTHLMQNALELPRIKEYPTLWGKFI